MMQLLKRSFQGISKEEGKFMYGINKATYTPNNFYLGCFPVIPEHGTIKEGAIVRKHVPIAQGTDGLEEVTTENLKQIVGITADEPDDNGNIVYYQTGEFNSESVILPDGVTIDELRAACRSLSIFLK